VNRRFKDWLWFDLVVIICAGIVVWGSVPWWAGLLGLALYYNGLMTGMFYNR
jgi:hypothetical protein